MTSNLSLPSTNPSPRKTQIVARNHKRTSFPRSARRSSISGTRSRRNTTKVRSQRILDACTHRLFSCLVLEQLPLSLHRQFKLMRELDSQGEGASKGSLVSVSLILLPRAVFHADLLASVRRYIHLRESLAARNAQSNPIYAEGDQPNSTDVKKSDADQGGETSPDAMQVNSGESSHDKAIVNDNGANAGPPVAYQPKPGETTRTLLQHIAQTSEEAIRTAEEKVNIAQTAYETVRESSALSRVYTTRVFVR